MKKTKTPKTITISHPDFAGLVKKQFIKSKFPKWKFEEYDIKKINRLDQKVFHIDLRGDVEIDPSSFYDAYNAKNQLVIDLPGICLCDLS